MAEAKWQLYSFYSKYHKRLVPSRQKPTGCYTLSGGRYILYPPKGLCKADTEGGPIVFTYVLFGLGNVYWTFNLQAVFCLFETLKMFFPLRDSAEQSPKGVQLFLLYILLV